MKKKKQLSNFLDRFVDSNPLVAILIVPLLLSVASLAHGVIAGAGTETVVSLSVLAGLTTAGYIFAPSKQKHIQNQQDREFLSLEAEGDETYMVNARSIGSHFREIRELHSSKGSNVSYEDYQKAEGFTAWAASASAALRECKDNLNILTPYAKTISDQEAVTALERRANDLEVKLAEVDLAMEELCSDILNEGELKAEDPVLASFPQALGDDLLLLRKADEKIGELIKEI